MTKKPIQDAVKELKINLDKVARVYEWAELMGYKNSKLFSSHFLKHYRCLPSGVLKQVRLLSIITMLQSDKSCREVAWEHSLPHEKALNNYTNYHLGISPRGIKSLPPNKLEEIVKKLKSKHME